MKGKIVVVGGGVMGVTIAYHTARRCDALSEPVILFERSGLAAGSSGRSGAILRQYYSDRVTAGMARDCLRVFGSFHRNSGRSVGFRATGVLTLAGPDRPEDLALLEGNVEMMTSIGIEVQRLEAQEIRDLVPGIEVKDGTLGAMEPKAGFVDPKLTVRALAALAREAGVVTRVGVGVEEILVENGRVVGVVTSDGRCTAEQVVVAAGPWTRRLLSDVGIDLPLTVLRPEQHFVAMPSIARDDEDDELTAELGGPLGTGLTLTQVEEDLDARFAANESSTVSAAHPVLLDTENNSYVKCEPADMRTRVGRMSTNEDEVLEDPDDLVEEVDEAFVRWARGALCARMPVYEELPDVESQAAWYTMTPDCQGVVGPVPGIEGLFVATGFSGHGFKLSPSIGEGVTQMLFGDAVSAFDPEFFSPERFAKGNVVQAARGFGL